MTLEDPFQPPVVARAQAIVDKMAAEADEAMAAAQRESQETERPYTPAEGLDPEAPYGYTIDRKTGEKRPRKRAGRGVRVVRVEEPPAETASEREPDRVPGRVKPEQKTRRTRTRQARPEPEPLPAFRAGPIAKGMNSLYLRAGRLIRAMDHDVGTAVIASTRAESEDDVTVGEAWEEVAKNNPRIRRVLLRLISGGAWSQLFMAHAPILLAVLLKERIARRLPLMRLLASFLGPDEEGAPGVDQAGEFLAGLTQDDLAQMAAAFNQFMPGMDFAAGPGRVPEAFRTPAAEQEWAGDAPA